MPRVRSQPFDNSVTSPISMSAAYFYTSSEEARQAREGHVHRGRYGRYDNPSWIEVEARLASLEGTEAALLFPSGMSAIATLTQSLAKAGDSILFTRRGYRNIATYFEQYAAASGIEVHGIDQGGEATFRMEFAKAYTDRCRFVFVEMPSNPHQLLVDLEFIGRSIDRRRTLIVVDSTFASPMNMQPARHGADLVVHSCTKYLSGDGDLVAGCVLGSPALIETIRAGRNITGAIPSGMTAWLLHRSLETFELRMERTNREGMALAGLLEAHPLVTRVHYTGLRSHPQAALARRYLSGHGGVIGFELDLDSAATARIVDRMALPFMGSNFGCHHAMIEQCAPFTFSKLSPAERASIGITDSLIRLSIGRYSAAALMQDFCDAVRPTVAFRAVVGA